MASGESDKTTERRKNIMVGDLPEDFLRVKRSASEQQIQADQQAATMLQQQLCGFLPPNAVGRLQVTVAQAKLVKNYGMTRMDPFVRMRVGHMVYETHTDHNGAKNPRWNKVVMCYLPQGVNTISIEIFDECAFTVDEKIAWCQVTIPDRVIANNETHDDWYPLSGKQGEEKEGSINIVVSYSPVTVTAPTFPTVYQSPVVMVPTPIYGAQVPYYGGMPAAYPGVQQVPVNERAVQPISEEDLKQVNEMFPNVEREVVKSVMEANCGNKDATINSLLSMAS